MKENLEDIRKDYQLDTLDISEVAIDPVQQFNQWMQAALDSNQEEPTAMTLATTSSEGIPDARIVLLKGVDEDGFRFYTNYDSTKGKNIAANNNVALVFFWPALQRQVRILGKAHKLPTEISEQYYHSRPKGSQISALVSPQSAEIESRIVLEEKAIELAAEYLHKEIPRPTNWGGYVVKPFQIEFWQGRSSRMHDRIQYQLAGIDTWKIVRLAP